MSTNDKLKVREAATEDATACSQVLCASIRDLCALDHQDDEQLIARWLANKTPETLKSWIESTEASIYVAEIDGHVVGVGGLSGSEVALNYVSPDCRGQGVSTIMLETLESELRDRDIHTAHLNSTATAHHFYLKAGWVDAGDPVESLGILGFPMTKDL